MVRLQKKIVKVKYKVHKFEILFKYSIKANDQLKDENLRLYAQNDELGRKDKRLRTWKTFRPHPSKRTSAQRLALQFTKFPVSFTKILEELAEAIGL